MKIVIYAEGSNVTSHEVKHRIEQIIANVEVTVIENSPRNLEGSRFNSVSIPYDPTI